MIKQKTHLKINNNLCGQIIALDKNYSKLQLLMTDDMVVDDKGLIHGGFIFNLADFASMVAVNHPNVVLGGANVKFLKPVRKGDVLVAEAKLASIERKKYLVNVEIKRDSEQIFQGDFICFITEKHVLEEGEKS